MNYTLEEFRKLIEECFYKPRKVERRMTIYTGPGGMDLVEECMEGEFGMKRTYVSKVPRFMKKFLKISRTGKYYKKWRIKK